MSEKLVTPVDKLTGMPLPILPEEVLPRDNPGIATLHHAMHPSIDPRLLGSDMGKALRSSVSYLTDCKKHNQAIKKKHDPGYHDLFHGPVIPETAQDVAELLVFIYAGARPRDAIDLNGGNPVVRRMNDKQWDIFSLPAQIPVLGEAKLRRLTNQGARNYEALMNPDIDKQTYVEGHIKANWERITHNARYQYHHISTGYEQARDFLTGYLYDQDIASVNPTLVERFLGAKDERSRRFLGYCCIGTAVALITDPMESRYTQVKQEGRLHPLAPDHARHKLAELMGTSARWDFLVNHIELNLRQELGVAA